MRFDTYSIVCLTTEILLLLFHFSVFFVIASQAVRRKYPYTSAFYKLYIVQGVLDWLNYIPVGGRKSTPHRASHWTFAVSVHARHSAELPRPSSGVLQYATLLAGSAHLLSSRVHCELRILLSFRGCF